MCNEMIKLREMLDAEGIEWLDASTGSPDCLDIDLSIDRTHFIHRGFHWSVINGYGTYGGGWFFTSSGCAIRHLDDNKGLLELMSNAVNGGEPIGFLTAEDCMEIVLGNKIRRLFK